MSIHMGMNDIVVLVIRPASIYGCAPHFLSTCGRQPILFILSLVMDMLEGEVGKSDSLFVKQGNANDHMSTARSFLPIL